MQSNGACRGRLVHLPRNTHAGRLTVRLSACRMQVLEELAADAVMDPFRVEYEKLHRALRKTYGEAGGVEAWRLVWWAPQSEAVSHTSSEASRGRCVLCAATVAWACALRVPGRLILRVGAIEGGSTSPGQLALRSVPPARLSPRELGKGADVRPGNRLHCWACGRLTAGLLAPWLGATFHPCALTRQTCAIVDPSRPWALPRPRREPGSTSKKMPGTQLRYQFERQQGAERIKAERGGPGDGGGAEAGDQQGLEDGGR